MGVLWQRLNLGALPPGLKFEVLDVTPSTPNRQLYATFQRDPSHFASTINTVGMQFPYQVDVGKSIGLIGFELMMQPLDFIESGKNGAKVDIKFGISGTTVVDGVTKRVDNHGYISVSTSEWGRAGIRPDYCNVSYYWAGGSPANASLSVPGTIVGQPDHVYFVFGVSTRAAAQGDVLAMNCTCSTDAVATAVDWILKGIFMAHEKMFGFVVGKLNPF